MKLPENSLFAILMRARWWTSALVTLGVLAVGGMLLPGNLAFFAALPFGVITCVVVWHEIREPRGARLVRRLETLRAMPWEQFADALEAGYRHAGYAVKRIEGAADFELEKDGRISLLSARRWKAAVTGIEPLRELAAAGERRGAAECLIAVAGDMSEKARTFLKDKGLKAVEGSELVMRTRRKR